MRWGGGGDGVGRGRAAQESRAMVFPLLERDNRERACQYLRHSFNTYSLLQLLCSSAVSIARKALYDRKKVAR